MLPSNTGMDRHGPASCQRAHRNARRAALAGAAGVALFGLLCARAGATEQPPAADLDLAKYRGQVLILDFWASWCKPCRQSIPWLNEMRARYGANGLAIVGVNVDAERGDAERFLRDVPIDFEIVFDPKGQLAGRFKLKGMPTSYVFDRAGNMVDTHIGFRNASKADHEAVLKELLSRPAK
jgi:thiol-disulfide isomerase/thioredoxin